MRTFIAVLLVGFAAITLGCNVKSHPVPPVPPESKKKHTQDEMKLLVIGKSREEVSSLVGKPDDTNARHLVGGIPDEFYYDRLVIEPYSENYLPFYIRFNAQGIATVCGRRLSK